MRETQPAVYSITNTLTGDVYIGSTNDCAKRWREHRRELRIGKHHSRYLQRSYDMHGAEHFAFAIVEHVAPGDSLNERLREREQYYLDALKPAYNMAPEAGLPPTGPLSDEHRAKLSAAHKGKTLTEAHRQVLSAVRKGVPKPKSVAAMLAVTTGKAKSAEHKAKLSAASAAYFEANPDALRQRMEAMRAKSHTPEANAKRAAAGIGRVYSAETRTKMSASRKRVAARKRAEKLSAQPSLF